MLTKLYKPREFDKEQGFTLIELLVVIVIIGILAAIALPIFLNQQHAAMNATVQSDARNTVIGVRAGLVTTPEAAGFTLLHAGDTASYALIQSPLVHTAVIPVPAGNIGVYMVESKDNVSVITDVAHEGPTALATLASASPDWKSWVVHSENKLTGYWYEFDSTTGKYTDGTKTPVGSDYVPDATMNGGGSGGTGGTGGSGTTAGAVTATNVAYGGQNSWVSFDAPVSGTTSDFPWAVGKDFSTGPFSKAVTDLHLYVGNTEVPLNAAADLSHWYLGIGDFGAGVGNTIEYQNDYSQNVQADITAAGFTMDQFYSTGKINATVDGIANNVMNMNIPTGSSSIEYGNPPTGYPGGAAPVDYSTWGTQGNSAISISSNAFHNGSQPEIARFGFVSRDTGTNGNFPHNAAQDPRLGTLNSQGTVQIKHFYTVVNGTYTEMTLHNPNSISFTGGASVDGSGNVNWSVFSDNGNGQGANAGGFYVTDPNGNRTDPTTGREYADLILSTNGTNGFYGDAGATSWQVIVVFRFSGATADFWTHQVGATSFN